MFLAASTSSPTAVGGLARSFDVGWATLAAAALALLVGIFNLVFEFIKSSGEGRRAIADSRARRYQEAAAQLGHDKPAIRLAGVYAMAQLADDWGEQRQTCVEVLCAFLRIEAADLETTFGGTESEVWRSTMKVLQNHLHKNAPISWSDCRFNFDGLRASHFFMEDCIFNHKVSFFESEFYQCTLDGSVFKAGFDIYMQHSPQPLLLSLRNVSVLGGRSRIAMPPSGSARAYLEITHLGHLASINFNSFGDRAGQISLSTQRQLRRQGVILIAHQTFSRGDELCVRPGFEDERGGGSYPAVRISSCRFKAGARVEIKGRESGAPLQVPVLRDNTFDADFEGDISETMQRDQTTQLSLEDRMRELIDPRFR